MAKKPNWSLSFRRFSFQLPILFFAAGFVAILVFSGVIYFAISNVLLNETIKQTQSMMNMGSVNITTYIDRLKSESALFAGDPALKEYLSEPDSEKEEQLKKRIENMLVNNSYVQSIVAVSKDGRVLSNEKDLDMTVSADMMKEKWYTNAIHDNMPVLTGARMQNFSTDKDNWVISVSTEVIGENGENAGVLLVDMKYSVIEKLIQNLELGRDGYVFLLDNQLEPVYHKDTEYFQSTDKKNELKALFKQGNHYNSSKNLLTSQAEIKNAGWTMVAAVYLDNLTVLKQHLFETVIFTGVLLLLIILSIGTIFTRRLSRPIQKLEKNMLQIEKLAEIQLEKHNFYEMELFAGNYNQMIRRIRHLLETLSEKEEDLRRLELQALIDQINPHFLYNTLDTIVWMAEFNDSKKVIALTKSLASFFRISLSGGREIITVAEELEHARQYLFIQKARYEGKLNYEINADEAVLQCAMPKIILQPLIENSIYHGIKPLEGPGFIQIVAEKCGEQFHIIVSDNGVGFDRERGEKQNTGVGLNNVRERIKLYYGESGSIDIISQPGQGCKVTVTISVKRPHLLGLSGDKEIT